MRVILLDLSDGLVIDMYVFLFHVDVFLAVAERAHDLRQRGLDGALLQLQALDLSLRLLTLRAQQLQPCRERTQAYYI